jgi:hypothetical protein
MSQLGVVTSLTQFARSIGATIGVAIFGSLLTNRFAPAFQTALPPEVRTVVPPDRLAQFENPQALLNPQAADAMRQTLLRLGPQGAQVYDELFAAIKIALVAALHDVFLLGGILAALGVVVVLFMRELPLRKSYGPPPTADSAAQVGHHAGPSLPQLKPEDQPAREQPAPQPIGEVA